MTLRQMQKYQIQHIQTAAVTANPEEGKHILKKVKFLCHNAIFIAKFK